MPIFSRRSVQQMLDQNARFLTREQIKRHIHTLNRADEASVACEWEITCLYALGQVGDVTHEPATLGTTRVDVLFQSRNKNGCSFVADITTVSDRGSEDLNPHEMFRGEFYRQLARYRVNSEYFGYQIDGELAGKKKENRRMLLALPSKEQLTQGIFNERFRHFMRTVVSAPKAPHEFLVRDGAAKVRIQYDSVRPPLSRWPSYTVAYSLESNPVYNALERKAKQLSATSYNGPKGIILCDADCDMLRSRHQSGGAYSVDQVIRNVLRKHSIAFVLTITSIREYGVLGHREPELRAKFYPNTFRKETRLNEIHDCLESALQYLPNPVMDALNVHRRPRDEEHAGFSFYGGMEIEVNAKSTTVRISVRALLKLLAGKVTQEQFFRDHGFVPTPRHPRGHNPFAGQLSRGVLPSSASIEKSGDQDDDWLVLTFNYQDAAISPFTTPKAALPFVVRLKEKFLRRRTTKRRSRNK